MNVLLAEANVPFLSSNTQDFIEVRWIIMRAVRLRIPEL